MTSLAKMVRVEVVGLEEVEHLLTCHKEEEGHLRILEMAIVTEVEIQQEWVSSHQELDIVGDAIPRQVGHDRRNSGFKLFCCQELWGSNDVLHEDYLEAAGFRGV